MTLRFTLVINGQTVTTQNYAQFIQEIRNRLQATTIRNRPVLIPEVNPPTPFFDEIIENERHSARFRLRVDNFYVIGFQVNDGQWWAFSDATTLINEPDTDPLRFNGSYGELLSQIPGVDELYQINIGLPQLQNVMDKFAQAAAEAPSNWGTVARYLIVAIMMICESARFAEISNFIIRNSNSDFLIPPWMEDLANTWGSLSAAVIDGTANPEVRFPMNNIRLPGGRVVASVLNAYLAFSSIFTSDVTRRCPRAMHRRIVP